VNLTHHGIKSLEKSMYVIQWNVVFLLFCSNPETHNSNMKLPYSLTHQVQEPTEVMADVSSHLLRDLNAKPASGHIVGNRLCAITYDWNVERSPSFSVHIVLIEQNLVGTFINTSD
jgi:hypothetical protein